MSSALRIAMVERPRTCSETSTEQRFCLRGESFSTRMLAHPLSKADPSSKFSGAHYSALEVFGDP